MEENIKAFKDYLEKEKKYSKLTVKAYIRDVEVFKMFVVEEYDGLFLEDVSYPIIRSWVVFLLEIGNSNNSVNRKIASLKAFYRFLLKVKVIQKNPLITHKALKVSKKIQIPFSKKEVEDVLSFFIELNTFEEVRDRLIIELLYATGIRRAELITLKASDVDMKKATLKVLGKRNKERILPVIPSVIKLLEQYDKIKQNQLGEIHDDTLILSKKGKKVSEMFVYRLINNYFSTISQKSKKSPHVLRHTFATHLLNNGANLNAVKELLGHASLASTQVYTHANLSELKKIYNKAHPRDAK